MSKILAFISDIHANIDALNSVLADIETTDFSGIICLGDIVGYGPEPARCVQRVMDTCAATVLGNHEAMLFMAGKRSEEEYGRGIGEPLVLAHSQLSEAQYAWLRELPLQARLGEAITLVHATLDRPNYFDYITSAEAAAACFIEQTTPLSFHGHTHVPVIWEDTAYGPKLHLSEDSPRVLDPAARHAINPGSVGQPRDDDPRASYALLDLETMTLTHRRVPYDIEQARARFKAAGLIPKNADRLLKGM